MSGEVGAIAEQPYRPLELYPDRAMRRERSPYAVVDIGSNSVRLVVYDGLGRAPFPRFNEKSLCRLASGLDNTGELSVDGFHRAVEATRRFRAIADAMGVTRIDVLATEATRKARNGKELVASILAEAKLDVRILSGAEEARYAAWGVISGFFRPVGLVGDMGGGSLELARVHDDRVEEHYLSLPLGALPALGLLARYGRDASKRVDALLHDEVGQVFSEPVFYAVGGGWRALAKTYMAHVNSPVRVVQGFQPNVRQLRDFAKALWRMPDTALAKLPGVPPRRRETLPGAAFILDRLLKHLQPELIIFSALGVREGWLYSQLSKDEQYLDPLIEGAQLLGLPQARVASFASALARWTSRLVAGESPADERVRVAACALSDIGWRDHEGVRAAESFRRLLHFPFIGLSHPERAKLAAVVHARYAGRIDDPVLAPARALLTPKALQNARVLGLAMLLAYRFSGAVPQILESSHLILGIKGVRLVVGKAARAPDSEAVTDRLRLLADAVGVSHVEIVEGDESYAAQEQR
jgi:exopolyphosphatase / guanosine-5'-triphosphate,3'-diphosphate pyrophosphatase